jgi:hypothetical protein
MPEWPPLVDDELHERLALDQDGFEAMVSSFMSMAEPHPERADPVYHHAIAYPWDRPTGSFVFDGLVAQPLTPRAVAAFLEADRSTRYPLLAIGSNGAASALARKFAHLPEADRSLIAFAGRLVDFDIGPAAVVTVYGSLPATPFTSPGAAVHASVLWVNAAQLTALTWTEVSYRLGRLDSVRFVPDDEGAAIDHALLYVSRYGTLGVDGAPVALAAMPATGRAARAMTQAELLDHTARLVFGEACDGLELVRRMTAAPGETLLVCRRTLHASAVPFEATGWSVYPAAPRD